MQLRTKEKIRIRLESFNSELLAASCKKMLDLFDKNFVNCAKIISLPTRKRVYCVLRSPHVNKDSREHFEIRTHKKIIDVEYDLSYPILESLSFLDSIPGILCKIFFI